MSNATTMSDMQFLKWMDTEDAAVSFFEAHRWRDGRSCPTCGSLDSYRHKSKKYYYRCRDCRKQFSARMGTVMESSPIPVREWLYMMYKISISRKGVSSLQLAKELGRPQKTTWFMLKRLQEACGNKFTVLDGEVEADETYVGGKEKNRHESKKSKRGRGTTGKQPVLGMRKREGEIVAKLILDTLTQSIDSAVRAAVEPGSKIYTDDHSSYRLLDTEYQHKTVNHFANEYVKGMAHTNSIESFWAVLKRSLTGTYHHISMKHLARYVNEAAWRLNEGNVQIQIELRIAALCAMTSDVTIPWKTLIGGRQCRYRLKNLCAP